MRSAIRALQIGTLLTWLVVMCPWATAGTKDFAGNWIGWWALGDHSQWGTLELTIQRDGAVRGFVTNGPMIGPWDGRVDAAGLMTARYQLANNGPFEARAQLSSRAHGSLAGPITFSHGRTELGKGQMQVERQQAAEFSPAVLQLAQRSFQLAAARQQGQVFPEDVATFGLLLAQMQTGRVPTLAIVEASLARARLDSTMTSHRIKGYRTYWLSHLGQVNWARFPMRTEQELLNAYGAYLDRKFEARQNRINQRLAAIVGSEEAWHKAITALRVHDAKTHQMRVISENEYRVYREVLRVKALASRAGVRITGEQ